MVGRVQGVMLVGSLLAGCRPVLPQPPPEQPQPQPQPPEQPQPARPGLEDPDGDGFLGGVDECPADPGVEPDGCPPRDTDGDGILDADDKCVTNPETKNAYADDDGCPDEVPAQLGRFAGTIQGIYFAAGQAVIRPKSTAALERAASVLQQFPRTRIEICGHTDAGEPPALSLRRAEAVRADLIARGVAAERMRVRGAADAEPNDTSGTPAGRAKNRRIEFIPLAD